MFNDHVEEKLKSEVEMRKDRSIATYGRHKNRVIVTDGWSSEDRKKKNIFSTSSELDSSKQSSIFHTSSSLSLNSTDASDAQTSYGLRKSTRRTQKNSKYADEKENVQPEKLQTRKTRNARAKREKAAAFSVSASASDSSLAHESGVRPTALRTRKNTINYNDSANMKKQLRGTTAKRKRPVKTAAALIPKNVSVNFSDFDDYSLVVSDTSGRKAQNNMSSIETSTPVAKRTKSKETVFDKMKASDISHIELVDSPTSDVCYTSLETPDSSHRNQGPHFCSPSLVSSASSLHQHTNASRQGLNTHDFKLTPESAVVRLEKLTGSFISTRSSNKNKSSSVNNQDKSSFDQSASLFSTPARTRGEHVSVNKLTGMFEHVSIRIEEASDEEEEEEEDESETEEAGEEHVSQEIVSVDEEEEEEEEEETSGEEDEEGLSAIHEVEEDDTEESDTETDTSDGESDEESVVSSGSDHSWLEPNETNDSSGTGKVGRRVTRNTSKGQGKLDKKAKVNLQRLSESLLSQHVSSRPGRHRGRHRHTDLLVTDEDDSSSFALSSGRESDSPNCTRYMLADNFESILGSNKRSSCRNSSGGLFEESEETEESREVSEETSIENCTETSAEMSGEKSGNMASLSEAAEEDSEGDGEVSGDESDKENRESSGMKTPKTINLRNRVVENLQNSFSEMLTPTRKRGSLVPLSAHTKVMLLCDQTEPVTFQEALPTRVMSVCKKIGEGVYGEVFSSKQGGQNVAIKIIPIEGDFPVNDEPQKKFAEILPEIVIAKELSNLRLSKAENTCSFCEVLSVSLVQGKYPPQLIRQWDTFSKTKGSENDRPDMFPATQLYVLFVFADCGRDLESFQFDSMDQARSVLAQVTLALAVAEHTLQFEHRDLHWGNVLIRPTEEEEVRFRLMGRWVAVPTMGVEANVIDFTLSRLRKDGVTVFSDLSTDDTLFEGEGDLQFDVYRNMKKENKNNWESFVPYTNVLWLHYLADKLVYCKRYPVQTSRQGREALRLFRQFLSKMLNYQSACEMAIGADFLNS